MILRNACCHVYMTKVNLTYCLELASSPISYIDSVTNMRYNFTMYTYSRLMIYDTNKIANVISWTINKELTDEETATIQSLVEKWFAQLQRTIVDNVVQEFSKATWVDVQKTRTFIERLKDLLGLN